MPIFGNAVAPRLTRASLAGPHDTKGGPRGACNAPERGHAVLVDQPSCRALTQPAEPRASNTGGSVRRLSTRGRGELARSPGMSRPPAVIMPSIGRTCGRPSSSSAPVCRIGAGGRGRRPQGTHISATACATTVRLRIRARNSKLRPDPEAQRQPAARWLTPCSFVLRPLREPFRSHPVLLHTAVINIIYRDK